MISGSFFYNLKSYSLSDISRPVNAGEELVFHPVATENFTGGYYLHDRLPLRTVDFLWTDEASGVKVLLSGHVYNRIELNAIIKSDDPVPDPELIGRLFQREGPGFVAKLNGDFAIAIINPNEREVWLFRDHVGIRPLAYSIRHDTLFFSTDIVSLCSSLCGGKEIDTVYLTGHFRYIDFRTTPCREVKKLLPGHYLHFKGGRMYVRKYWEPEKIRHDRSLTYELMFSELETLLGDAVRIRCDSRFTTAAHVSSGLDSGVVAALARMEYAGQDKFCGFSWSPGKHTAKGVNYDERELVRTLCSQHNILPLFSELDPEGFTEAISRIWLNHGFFWEEAVLGQSTEAGVNLLFSGWGGDEFISTAAPSIESDLLLGLRLRLFFRRNELRKPLKFLNNVIRYIVMPALCIHERGTAQAFRDKARYLRPQWQRSDRRAIRQFYFHSSRRGHHLGMLRFYHLQDRCEKWFGMGYRQGVEYRYPLLDRRIIEFMLRVPSELLCATDYSRPLLRELGVGLLPEEVRINTSKRDPVFREHMAVLYRDAAMAFIGETDRWSENPDLGFIDFERLSADIATYQSGDAPADDERLFRGLVWIKAMDIFTRVYRSEGMKQSSCV